MALVDQWPPFGIRVRTPRLELRVPDDALGGQMGELAAKGVHDPAVMPFFFPWTDAPAGEIPRNTLQHLWQMRAELGPEHWHLSLAVLVDGEVVGGGGLVGKDFALCRGFETGSWLGLEFQGHGLGKELRHACLHLGFAGLGAAFAVTGAFEDNGASLGVTRALGYEPNGEEAVVRRGKAARLLHFRMPRAHWEAVLRRDDIELEGVDPCLALLGADPSDEDSA